VPPTPHASPEGHVPQSIAAPQPSAIVPQLSCGGHVVNGTQLQTFVVHTSPLGQVPHEIVPPHPSFIVPQLNPAVHCVSGLHGTHVKL
jgi:hypothetical protein